MKNTLKTICKDHGINLTYSDAKEALNTLSFHEGEADFYFELDGMEFRLIHEESIWEIYVDTIRDIVEDCYEMNVPNFVAIDWEETAQNAYVDGYGHTFSSYDGSESLEDGYYIFRTN